MRIEKGRLRLPLYTEHLTALEGWVVGGSFRLGSDGADDPHPPQRQISKLPYLSSSSLPAR